MDYRLILRMLWVRDQSLVATLTGDELDVAPGSDIDAEREQLGR